MNITVYCGSSRGADPRFVEAAHELGAWIGSQGHALVYGGSSIGLMGIVARTAMEAGGRAYGVEPRFFIDAGVAQCDLTELFVVESMSERKACTSKKRYPYRSDAEEAIELCAQHGTRGLHCYRCPYCDGWHLTSKPMRD